MQVLWSRGVRETDKKRYTRWTPTPVTAPCSVFAVLIAARVLMAAVAGRIMYGLAHPEIQITTAILC